MGNFVKVDGPVPSVCCLITLADALGSAAHCEACGQRWERGDEWHRVEGADD